MSQLTLPLATPAGRCGQCVHRNAAIGAEQGSCSPGGWRHRDDPPCEHWFGHEQLALALYGRRKEAA